MKKIDNTEVDFIASSADDKIYIQVTKGMASEDVRERELRPLKKSEIITKNCSFSLYRS